MHNNHEIVNNEQQSKIIKCDNKSILVVAAAGTGKTKTITNKINSIITQDKSKKYNILCVTFTNKAAKELNDRMNNALYWCGTFHKISIQIIKKYFDPKELPITKNFIIIDRREQKKIISKFVKQDMLNEVLQDISLVKNMQKKLADSQFTDKIQEYNNELVKMDACDFDDLLLYAIQIIKSNEHIRNKFEYIFVDEYQDINDIQYSWIKAFKTQNIICVGDDDQSIYEWRGANIRHIHNFQKDFTDSVILKLEKNYRSDGFIIDAAAMLIDKNKKRIHKQMNAHKTQQEQVQLQCFVSHEKEIEYILTQAEKFMHMDKTVAIITRTNRQIQQIERIAAQKSIKIIKNRKNMMDIQDVKTIIYYITYVYSKNKHALQKILNVPKRSIGPVTETKIMTYIYNGVQLEDIKISKNIDNKIHELIEFIQTLEAMHKDELVKKIAEYINTDYEEQVECLQTIIQESQNIEVFLENTSLFISEADESQSQNGIHIITIHDSKGKEFDAVFTPYWTDNSMPSAYSNNIEEERRLAYVCMTRAKMHLTITFSISNGYELLSPSPFLYEIFEESEIKKMLYTLYGY